MIAGAHHMKVTVTKLRITPHDQYKEVRKKVFPIQLDVVSSDQYADMLHIWIYYWNCLLLSKNGIISLN